jgi:uncharacterized membrane protein
VDTNVSSTSSKSFATSYVDSFKRFFGGVHFQFPQFNNDHPAVIYVNKIAEENYTLGQRVADKVASGMGSWQFIIGQSIVLALWAILNSVAWWVWKWDAYPFIAMNLLLSCQAAYAAPVIMMSQNRQAEKDRLTAQNDYQTDMKGEVEIRYLMEHLDHQDTLIFQIIQRLESQHQEMLERLSRLDPEMAKKLGTDIVHLSEDELDESDDDISGNS